MKLVNRITDSAFDNFFDDETSLTWRRGDVVREALDG